MKLPSLPKYIGLALFVVALTATSCCGIREESNRAPSASFEVTPILGDTTTVFSFDASASTDPDGSITSYAWDFGDENSTTGVTTTHQYASTNTYTVDLTVTDNNAAKNTVSKQVVVNTVGTSYLKGGAIILTEITGFLDIGSGVGTFFELSEAQPAPTDEQFFIALQDRCFFDDQPDLGLPEPAPGVTSTSLDAGAALTIKSGASTYATLEKITVDSSIRYGRPDFLTAPLPSDLTATVPGAPGGFPAFSDKDFPTVPAFVLTSASKGITKDTIFTWTAKPTPSIIMLGVMGEDSSKTAIDLVCYAKDDGSFTFPANTRSELDSRGFTNGELMTGGRMGVKTYHDGDTMLSLVIAKVVSFLTI